MNTHTLQRLLLLTIVTTCISCGKSQKPGALDSSVGDTVKMTKTTDTAASAAIVPKEADYSPAPAGVTMAKVTNVQLGTATAFRVFVQPGNAILQALNDQAPNPAQLSAMYFYNGNWLPFPNPALVPRGGNVYDEVYTDHPAIGQTVTITVTCQ